MQDTKSVLNLKNQDLVKSSEEKKSHSASGAQSQNLEKPEISTNLSKTLAEELLHLIIKVNEDGVTPESVNASCNAAKQINNILRLNFDMMKDGF